MSYASKVKLTYNFPTVESPPHKYEHAVTLGNWDPSRIVIDVKSQRQEPKNVPAFHTIDLLYDYSEAGDRSAIGNILVTPDDGDEIVAEYGIGQPMQKLIDSMQGPRIPSHSVKIDLTKPGAGEKLRQVYTDVKDAAVKMLIANAKKIGNLGASALAAKNASDFFDSRVKPYDMAKQKMPDGEEELVPAKYLNLVCFTNGNKDSAVLTPEIKTHFYRPAGNPDKPEAVVNIHVRDLIKRKVTMLPYIYFQRIYIGANVSIQSYLDSALVLDVARAGGRTIAPEAVSRLAAYNTKYAKRFQELGENLKAGFSDEDGDVDELPSGQTVSPVSAAPPSEFEAEALPAAVETGADEFESALKAAATAKPAPRTFKRVGA